MLGGAPKKPVELIHPSPLNPQIGGPGVVVQIDESLFRHKSKYHRGRAPKKEVWVFGMVDTSFKPVRGYMEIVDRRDAATLIPIIERHVAPGSIIYSDQWRAYAQLSNNQNYTYASVNHSEYFVDPAKFHPVVF